MRQRLNTILFLIGIASIVVMILTFDVNFTEVWKCISDSGFWLLAAILLWAVAYELNAKVWRIIIRGSGPCPISSWQLWKMTVSGFALNTTVPIGGVGGEPYRILEAGRYIGNERATSSVILFAMMHIFSHFWFWLTGVAAYLLLVVIAKWSVDFMAVWTIILTCFISLGGIWFFVKGYRYGLVLRLARFLGKIPGLRNWSRRILDKYHQSLTDIDQQITALWCQNRKAFYQSLVIEYLCRWLQAFEVLFVMVMIGHYSGVLTIFYAFLIISFTSMYANLIGFIPLQVGGREGGFALSVAMLGIAPEVGIVISMVCRIREIVWVIIGIGIMRRK